MRPNKCPTCRKVGLWFDGPFGPFCSKRCRLIDLGKWLGEENKISEPLKGEHLEGASNGGYADWAPGQSLDRPKSDKKD